MWKACIVDSQYGALSQEALERLVENYKKVNLDVALVHYTTPAEIVEKCQDMDAILCCGNPPITREVVEGLPKLKVVERYGIGVNSVDLDAARENGVVVLNLPGVSVEELSVHVTALILDSLRHISFYDRGIRKGEWRKGKGVPPASPADMTIGLHGFGGTAKHLYRIFHEGFGSKIIAYDPYLKPENVTDYDLELVSFDELLERSDVISTQVPLNEETYHVFNYEAFKKMKNTATIINVARGPVICEEDLIRALNEGEIAAAGLDTFEQEPLPVESPLTSMENVVLSCHSAYYGQRSSVKTKEWVVDLMGQIVNENSIPRRFIANYGVVPRMTTLNILE